MTENVFDNSLLMATRGFTETVISRGKVVIDRGEYVGRAGDGMFVKRGPYGGQHAAATASFSRGRSPKTRENDSPRTLTPISLSKAIASC